ncbi:MAG: hypothetical protein AB3N09_13320 [Tateyamaria sp.]
MPHDIVNGAIGHNHAADHLHSHLKPEDEAADLQVITAQFIEGFQQAKDKAAYLSIAQIPLEIPCDSGGPALKLVDVALKTEWQVGTASPSFGSRELSYLPFPGEMITERTNMEFVYVSSARRAEVDLRSFLAKRQQHDHEHHHHD